jgi:hypothetical protein
VAGIAGAAEPVRAAQADGTAQAPLLARADLAQVDAPLQPLAEVVLEGARVGPLLRATRRT